MERIFWIIFVNFALYCKVLKHKFVSDDFTVWKNPPPVKNAWHKAWLRFIGAAKFQSPCPRILKYNGKWVLAIIKTEWLEHFIALLIHIAICVSIYFAFGASRAAFIAALLYSTNPVNNQGTIWPGGRGYALPILSLMLAMAVPILSPVLLYFCSWFTIGFFAPLALIGSSRWYLLGLMPVIWWLHSRKYTTAIKLKQKTETFDEDKKMNFNKVIVFFKTYGFYLVLCLIPFRITFYHNFLQSMAGNDIMKKRAHSMDRYFWVGLLAWFGTFVYAALHWGPLAWAFLAFLIAILPFCNVVRANQEIAERFACMPNVFLMFGLAQVISSYDVIVTAFLVFYATRAWWTVGLYRDEYWITEMAVVEDPHAWWAWHCRAMKRWDTQSYKEALILWVMAKLISPKEFKILMNIASCLRLLGNSKEADEYLALAEANIIAGQEVEAQNYIAEHRRGKLPILL